MQDTAQLLTTYFGLRSNDFPNNEKMTFLLDDQDSLVSVFRVSDVQYFKVFHTGFLQNMPERVRELHARLSADGVKVLPMQENHGRLIFYFQSGISITTGVEAFAPR